MAQHYINGGTLIILRDKFTGAEIELPMGEVVIYHEVEQVAESLRQDAFVRPIYQERQTLTVEADFSMVESKMRGAQRRRNQVEAIKALDGPRPQCSARHPGGGWQCLKRDGHDGQHEVHDIFDPVDSETWQ